MGNEQHAHESHALPLEWVRGVSAAAPASRFTPYPSICTWSSNPWQDKKKKNAQKILTEEMMHQGNDSGAAEEQLFSIWKGDKHPPNTDR